MAVAVVTDSTSDIPEEMTRDLGVTVVPLSVSFGTESFKDRVDLSADEFYRRLAGGGTLPKTSQPSVGDFVEVYRRLGDTADGIVSLHLSSILSGTFNSAVQATREAGIGCPVEVIDTRQASMGAGMATIVAARLAREGASLEATVGVARSAAGRCECVVLLDTLDYLVKGGRIGKARAMVGSLLRIKPLLIVRDGEVHELSKERTRRRAIAKLGQVAAGFAPAEEMAVMYSTTPDEAAALAESLQELLPDGKTPFVARFGPTLGTYTGPGALGLGMLRRGDG